jgi:uncharacterized membrane protein
MINRPLSRFSDQVLIIHVRLLQSTGELFKNAAIGYVPGWVVLIIILSFYSWMVYIMRTHRETRGELAYGEVHV